MHIELLHNQDKFAHSLRVKYIQEQKDYKKKEPLSLMQTTWVTTLTSPKKEFTHQWSFLPSHHT